MNIVNNTVRYGILAISMLVMGNMWGMGAQQYAEKKRSTAQEELAAQPSLLEQGQQAVNTLNKLQQGISNVRRVIRFGKIFGLSAAAAGATYSLTSTNVPVLNKAPGFQSCQNVVAPVISLGAGVAVYNNISAAVDSYENHLQTREFILNQTKLMIEQSSAAQLEQHKTTQEQIAALERSLKFEVAKFQQTLAESGINKDFIPTMVAAQEASLKKEFEAQFQVLGEALQTEREARQKDTAAIQQQMTTQHEAQTAQLTTLESQAVATRTANNQAKRQLLHQMQQSDTDRNTQHEALNTQLVTQAAETEAAKKAAAAAQKAAEEAQSASERAAKLAAESAENSKAILDFLKQKFGSKSDSSS